MKAGIMVNPHKAGARKTLNELMQALAAQGIETVLESGTVEFASGEHKGLPARELAEACDVVVVLGGDGTMLHAIDSFGGTDKPIAGINIGTLGFLTSCTDTEIEEFAAALKAGDFRSSRRTLLAVRVQRRNGQVEEYLALNEASITRGQTGRIGAMCVMVDGELLNHYRADGMIVATPTGSTAYSLSAGGPIISPSAGVFVITPVCPHTLSQRSLVVDEGVTIELMPEDPSEGPMAFTVDGRDRVELMPGDKVSVCKASQHLHFLRLKGRSFYGALRQKLHWRGG